MDLLCNLKRNCISNDDWQPYILRWRRSFLGKGRRTARSDRPNCWDIRCLKCIPVGSSVAGRYNY